jgi:hypothetical protein
MGDSGLTIDPMRGSTLSLGAGSLDDAPGLAEKKRRQMQDVQVLLDNTPLFEPPPLAISTKPTAQGLALGWNPFATAASSTPAPRATVTASAPRPFDPTLYTDDALRHTLAATRLQLGALPASSPQKPVLEQRLQQLQSEGDKRWGSYDACEDARPTLLPASRLPARPLLDAADLLSCSQQSGACATVDQVAAMETERQRLCATTGVDPMRFADLATGVPTVGVDHRAAEAARIAKWLAIIDSQTQNPLAAAVAASSLARGEGVDATLARVQLADAIGGVAASFAATGQRAQAFDTTAPVRIEREPTPLEPPPWARPSGSVPPSPSSAPAGATSGTVTAPAVSAVASSSAVATSYKPREMLSQYVGEHLPGNAIWRGRGAGQVTYLSATERQKVALDIRDGVIFDASGQRFDTATSSAIEGGRGRAIFVMDMQGNLYASNFQRMGEFHHSSFVAGGPVLAAGELVVDNGRLILVSDSSGHYQPAHEHMDQLMRVLEQKGVRVELVERETSATRAPRPR